MPRLRQFLIAAAAALAGCSPAPDVSWLTQPTRDQHSSAYFPIVTGPHAADCNTCHGTSNSFRNFDCVGCHLQAPTATIHAAIGGYSYDSQSCYGCHTDGVGQGSIDHRRNFPIAAGQIHAIGAQALHVPGTIQCTSCHTNASDRTKVDCTSCHTSAAMQPLHVAVADLPATYASPDATYKTSTLCLTCHADSTVPVTITRPHSPPAPAHAPFLIGSGEAHYQKSCLGCHVALRTDKPWAADFTKPQRCTGCHVEPATSSNHLGTSWAGYSGTYAYSDAACLRCHMDGDIGPFDHSADFPIMASDVHRSGVAPCLSCHTSSRRDREAHHAGRHHDVDRLRLFVRHQHAGRDGQHQRRLPQVPCRHHRDEDLDEPAGDADRDAQLAVFRRDFRQSPGEPDEERRSGLLRMPQHDERRQPALGRELDPGELHGVPQQPQLLRVQMSSFGFAHRRGKLPG